MSEQKKLKNNKHKQFGLGMLILITLWILFSLLFTSPVMPNLSPDESHDISALPDFTSFADTQKKSKPFLTSSFRLS
jgi:hypothetical protein